MLDNQIAYVFKEFKIAHRLKACRIRKKTGYAVNRIVFDLVHIPLLLRGTLYLFLRSQYEEAAFQRNRYYRLPKMPFITGFLKVRILMDFDF